MSRAARRWSEAPNQSLWTGEDVEREHVSEPDNLLTSSRSHILAVVGVPCNAMFCRGLPLPRRWNYAIRPQAVCKRYFLTLPNCQRPALTPG